LDDDAESDITKLPATTSEAGEPTCEVTPTKEPRRKKRKMEHDYDDAVESAVLQPSAAVCFRSLVYLDNRHIRKQLLSKHSFMFLLSDNHLPSIL